MTKQHPSTASEQPQTSEQRSSRRTAGLVLVGLGGFFLLHTFIGFSHIGKLWPLLLVIIGLAVIFGRGQRP